MSPITSEKLLTDKRFCVSSRRVLSRPQTRASLLHKLALAGMVGASVLFGAKEAKAEPIPWNSVEDIVPQVVGESFNYTSSNSSVLANKIVGICYIVDPTIGNVAVGGFDLLNGVVTKSYFNQDWNSTTGYDGSSPADGSHTDAGPFYYPNWIGQESRESTLS